MNAPDDDALYWRVCEYVTGGGSPRISHLQIRFRVGFNQASRWVERMRDNGVIAWPRDRLQ